MLLAQLLFASQAPDQAKLAAVVHACTTNHSHPEWKDDDGRIDEWGEDGLRRAD